MFAQTFKNVDDVLRHEAGCTTELDYTEQLFWVLFLKYLDNLEHPPWPSLMWRRLDARYVLKEVGGIRGGG